MQAGLPVPQSLGITAAYLCDPVLGEVVLAMFMIRAP